MIRRLQRCFALSRQGSIDLIKASCAAALQSLTLMLPAGILYSLVKDLYFHTLEGRGSFYIGACAFSVLLFMIATYLQYNTAFFATYIESGNRRIELAEHIRLLPLSFFSNRDISDLSTTVMSDCAFLETAFSHFVPLLAGAVISTAVVSVGLLSFSPLMALASVWPVPVSFAVIYFSRSVQNRCRRYSMEARLDCASHIAECLETIRDLKSCNAEKNYFEKLEKKFAAVERRTLVAELVNSLFIISATLVLKLGIATTALCGAVLFGRGAVDAMTVFAFLLVVSRMYDPLSIALQNLMAVIMIRVHVSRMNDILKTPLQRGVKKLTNVGTDIEFTDVSFAYDSEIPVLKNVSFTASQGEVTALVGPSGSGKTTALRLAARFWDVNSGKISVGGMDISSVDPETLLSLFSIVFQNVTLFNNSVIENIRIGKKDATDEECIRAGLRANCGEFVARLPEGWNTRIGEDGKLLSGGERQRISIARALLKDAPIVLLDEATASLDAENETLIQEALSRLTHGKTVVVIAHRMRTVAGVSKVVVFKEGRIVETGSPEELVERGGLFASFSEM